MHTFTPREIALIVVALTIIASIWSCLCASAVVALCSKSLHGKFWFALAPLIIGVLGVMSKMPIRINTDTVHINFNLGYLFLVPAAAALVALIRWFQAKFQISFY